MKRNVLPKLFIALLATLLLSTSVYAQDYSFKNDLRDLFIGKKSIIYTLNIRSFGAVDNNGDDLIEPDSNDVKGTFLNAADKLLGLTKIGVNTICLLPITKTGKLKALGTAGSLYSLDSFDEINPQLDDESNSLSVKQEATYFIEQAHKLGLRVIIDMPSCGSFDMSLAQPELFLKDKNNEAQIPADWTDVRLFKVYDENGQLNKNLIDNYKKMINLFQEIGADGVRVDVAAIKPQEFWKEIIDYARLKDNQFLFLAEASTAWGNPIAQQKHYATVRELLSAGFDGYYGDWGNFRDFTKGDDVIKRMLLDLKIEEEFNNKVATMASFATHDQTSLTSFGTNAPWHMVNWLNMTLPLNSYILDGFVSGDNYIFNYANKKVKKSYTDDKFCFVHRAKFDIFNFSRPAKNDNEQLKKEFVDAVKFKYWAKNPLVAGEFIPLKASHPSAFAYVRSSGDDAVLVIGNVNFKQEINTDVKIRHLREDSFISPVKITNPCTLKRGKISTKLDAGEIQVYILSKVKF